MWTFTDDRGRTVTTEEVPQRIVAYARAGSTLWDYSIAPVAIFGSQHDTDLAGDPKVGALDLSAVSVVGSGDKVDVDAIAALEPDLIVSVVYASDDLYGVPASVSAQLELLAPSVGISIASGRSLTVPVERFAALASSLRPDADSSSADLDKATDFLRTVSDPVKVLVISGESDEAYLPNPADWPDLRYLAEHGVDLVEPGVENGQYWKALPWADLPDIEADVILYDARPHSLGPDALAGIPQWKSHPAVASGRIAPWNAEAPLSYSAAARVVSDVAEALLQR